MLWVNPQLWASGLIVSIWTHCMSHTVLKKKRYMLHINIGLKIRPASIHGSGELEQESNNFL